MRRPPDIPTLRAAWWAYRALSEARRQLPRRELAGVALSPPPPLPPHASRGVSALLRRREHSCLEAALVQQRWLASRGERRDVIIGVTSPVGGFDAHAWLDGDHTGQEVSLHELTRLPAP